MLILGTTTHIRYGNPSHQFQYPLYMMQIDVEQLETLNHASWFWGYNKRRLIAIYDQDYLEKGSVPLAQKIEKITGRFKRADEVSRVSMVCIPRFIKASFRPVSFYLCYTQENDLIGLVAEVTNTYKEAHFYEMETEPDEGKTRFQTEKNFHVSPFFDEQGEYYFTVKDQDHHFEVHIQYRDKGEKKFYANFVGRKVALNKWQIVRLCMAYPFTTFLVYPRIMIQAAILYFSKKLPVFSKPKPDLDYALRPMPLSRFDAVFLRMIQKTCQAFENGALQLILPGGEIVRIGHDTQPIMATIVVSNTRFFKSIRRGGEIGLGESYVKGEWDSPSCPDVIAFFIRYLDEIEKKFKGHLLQTLRDRLLHRLNQNSMKKSRSNISAHYDLSNDFYQLFLDQNMMYSSALYHTQTDSLEIAQKQKVNRLLTELNLKPRQSVLEIGSGWGYVAREIAKTYRCHVTSITLSKEQVDYCQEKGEKQGLSDDISVVFQDYRQVTGEFDAIISIEMIEAVGHDYLQEYMEVVNRSLKEGGYFVLQTITYPDDRYPEYCKGTDFIRKHIFPGGHLPSLKTIRDLCRNHTDLIETNQLNIAGSYALTLEEWNRRFLNQIEQVKSLGFDATFIRKWRYYLSYCKAAFKTGYLGCYQLTFQKRRTLC